MCPTHISVRTENVVSLSLNFRKCHHFRTLS
nr:MAG TPA: hypothetical protein [Caudoviricetes sp.]